MKVPKHLSSPPPESPNGSQKATPVHAIKVAASNAVTRATPALQAVAAEAPAVLSILQCGSDSKGDDDEAKP